MNEQTQYTFEDWLHNKFWKEKGLTEQYVCNDSEQYLHLVSMGKMTYEVLNKIQDEQSKAYEYMIKCTLETNEKFFKRQAAKSLDLQKVIEIKIKKIEKYIQDNEDLYYDVILPRLHRGIKIGAKYILPEQYLKYSKNDYLDAFIVIHAPYRIGINGKLVSFPTDEQMKYAQMETQALWLKRLQEYCKNGYSDTPALETIFDAAKPGYNLCLQLLKELEFVDDKGNTLQKANVEILGIAVALKESSHNLLKAKYSDDELVNIIQQHLKIPFSTDNKRRYKGFHLTKDEAKKLINNYMKKVRAT